jgi:hypothetical protein
MNKSNISVGTKGWADRINASWRETLHAWRRSVEKIFDTGRALLACKEAVPHGDFTRMLESELEFQPRIAQWLMAIARDERLSRSEIFSFLPPSYTAIYRLTKLDDSELEQAAKDGTINPEMKGKDVPKKRKESPQGGAVLAAGGGPPLPAATDIQPPQDAVKGEDSGVTEYNPERAAVVELESKPSETQWGSLDEAGSSGDANARLPLGGQGKGKPQTPRLDGGERPATGLVAYHINPHDPMSRLATGLALAMAASRELGFAAAARAWPEDMPLQANEITVFYSWLSGFDVQFREHWGAGNDAGLALP